MGTASASSATTVAVPSTHQSPLSQPLSTSKMNNNHSQSKSTSFFNLFEFDVESLEQSRFLRAGAAGSIAGLCEHSLLYPIDTVKTRMQSVLLSPHKSEYKSFIDCFAQIIKNERISALFRGYPAVVAAAVPSHASYFAAYEYCKYSLNAQEGIHPFKIALSGAFAAMAHDAIVTPFDVIKQRMQLKNCPYANICSCAFDTLKNEGKLSFFRSYPTTVLLNVPTFSTNFVVYESTKIGLSDTILASEEYWAHHLIAGGMAGGVAGLLSNPLDVIKTSIQTDACAGYKSIGQTFRQIKQANAANPYKIFWSGASARATYMIPSAAITWTVYEAMKTYLGFPIHDIPMI